MLKKLDYTKLNIDKNKTKLICPICKKDVFIYENSIKCLNNHCFDISHKGYVSLIKNNKKRIDKIYDKDLFDNRVEFINNGFYNELHALIKNIINNSINVSLIVDAGSGDGTHDNKVLDLLDNDNIYIFGVDISKEGVEISTKYVNNNFIPIIADLNKLPFKDNSVDIILNILSPSNEQEMRRVLKKNGTIIKVTPKKEYLKELRMALGVKDYQNEDVIDQNIKNNYIVKKKYEIMENFALSEKNLEHLIKMTPMSNNLNLNIKKINSITIALNVYVLEIKE